MSFELPASIHQKCSHALGAEILSVKYVGGGSISQSRLLKTTRGDFFIKINTASFAGKMFETEAKGLQLLVGAKTLRTPSVIVHGQTGEGAFLLLEFIEKGYRQAGFWESFGESLAALHQCTAPQFGLDHSNFIGSLPQPNGFHETWADFYAHERLQPQLDLALSSKRMTKQDAKKFEKLYLKLPDICPIEAPALIHGDLWSGNFLVSPDSQAVLIDPAVSYAHREMDLSMCRLFGGFDRPFYESYEATFPLVPGFEQRLPIYQLYFLMVHVNLFGGGYLRSARGVLERFV